MTEVTRILADYAAELKFENLPDDVVAHIKRLTLDQIGCQLAAYSLPWCRKVFHFARDYGVQGPCTVVKYGLKTSMEEAVFVNSTFGHAFELDDTDMKAVYHPGCQVIPSSLAAAEQEAADGKTFMAGAFTGYEVSARIGRGMAYSAQARGFHLVGVLGTFAAAAGVSRILGQGREEMLNALAMAGGCSMAVKEYTNSGGDIKRLHASLAARQGVRAALLAGYGLTGSPTLIEGEKGLCACFADEYDLDAILDGLGSDYKILDSAFKIHAACRATHSGIDAGLEIGRNHKIDPDAVDRIVIQGTTPSMAAVGRILQPTDVTGAQFSVAFSAALAMVRQSNWLEDYTADTLKDPVLLGLARKTVIEVDPELDDRVTEARGATRITVHLTNGERISAFSEHARGTTQNPLDDDEIKAKFRNLAGRALPDDRVEQIIAMVGDLENLRDMRALSRLVAA